MAHGISLDGCHSHFIFRVCCGPIEPIALVVFSKPFKFRTVFPARGWVRWEACLSGLLPTRTWNTQIPPATADAQGTLHKPHHREIPAEIL